MKRVNIEVALPILVPIVMFWALGSFVGSSIKQAHGNCGIDYQIDRIFATDLFCPLTPTREADGK